MPDPHPHLLAPPPLPSTRRDDVVFWTFTGGLAALLAVSLGVLVLSTPPPSHELPPDLEAAVAHVAEAPAGIFEPGAERFALPAGGDAFVTTDLRDAYVWAGGDSLGPAPVLLTDLPPGRHPISVRTASGAIDTAVVLGGETFVHLHLEAPTRTARARTPRATVRSRQPEPRPAEGSRVGWDQARADAVERTRSRVAW
jgi:hypothetical protein